jgi:hypothetical protein
MKNTWRSQSFDRLCRFHRVGWLRNRAFQSPETGQTEHVLILRRDLVHCECAAYAANDGAEFDVGRIEFVREP